MRTLGRHHRTELRLGRDVKPHRAFDPRRVGDLECVAWVTYYRREWLKFLRAAVALTRHTFGLPWYSTAQGAWLVLRANQLWAPFPDNDPDGARRAMERFYRLVARTHGESFDPREAAEQRAFAMRRSDEWVADGRDLSSPMIDEERAALVRSYAALLAAVHRV
jgi:hypothetical protein